MTLREISTWILLVLFVWLFADYAWPLVSAGNLDAGGSREMFGFVAAFIVLFIIAHIVLAVIAPKLADENADERDQRNTLFAERAGSYALGAAAVFGLVVALIEDNRLFANIFFLGLVWSEIVKSVWLVALYRRGV